MNKIIQIYPWIDKKELEEVTKVIKSTFLTENKYTKKFEKKFRSITKAKYAIAINNWTMGLFCCLKALKIGKNDEVIVPDITFIASANAVILAGAKVVLCDVDSETLNISTSSIEKMITKRTKAIMPVHLYGNSCNMTKILQIAKKYKLKIIEDAAQGLGVFHKKKHVGTIGDVGGFSFYGNKLITTGEGGIITTNNKKIYDEIQQLKNHGRKVKGKFIHEKIGYNFMFTDIQAAIGLAQINKLKKIINKKLTIYKYYKSNIKKNEEIKYIKKLDKTSSVYWFSNIITKQALKLKKFLSKKNIESRNCFYPLSLQPCYDNNNDIIKKYVNKENSLNIYKSLLSLPSAAQININELNKVIKNINSFYEKKNKIIGKFS
jgi:perosamine synthetase